MSLVRQKQLHAETAHKTGKNIKTVYWAQLAISSLCTYQPQIVVPKCHHSANKWPLRRSGRNKAITGSTSLTTGCIIMWAICVFQETQIYRQSTYILLQHSYCSNIKLDFLSFRLFPGIWASFVWFLSSNWQSDLWQNPVRTAHIVIQKFF